MGFSKGGRGRPEGPAEEADEEGREREWWWWGVGWCRVWCLGPPRSLGGW